MRVFEAVAEEIAAQRTKYVFTLMSQETTKLTAELERRGVRVHHVRHEQIAIGMADGYARATGDVGVAIVGMGPGLTNAMNALITAAKARSPLVLVAGETAPVEGASDAQTKQARLVNKHIDQPALLNVLGIAHVDLRSGRTAVRDVRSAFASAREGRVVALDLPFQLLEVQAAAPGDGGEADRRPEAIAPSDVAAICDLLEAGFTARRPVIVAGRGAVRSGARAELLQLAELTGALVGTTVMAKGLFAGEPYSVGVVGTFATPVASDLLRSADLVIAFGASLNQHTTYFGSIFGKAPIVQIDADPAALGRHQDVALAVKADAHCAAAALVDELTRRGHRADGFRTAATASALDSFRIESTFSDRSSDGALDPRTLMLTLDRLLPTPRTVVVDAGNHMAFPIRYLSIDDSAGFMWPMEYSSVGCALGPALGAALARPERHVVLCIGDGGLMMTLADLDTAVRYRLPITVVVSNDSAFGAELHYMREQGYDDAPTRYSNPSFEEVARSLGLEAATVASVDDLERLRPRLAHRDRPLLLDCKVSPDVYGEFHTSLG